MTNLDGHLQQGSFHYIVIAQRFTDAMQATAEYLNEIAGPARFSLVEIVRFEGGGLNAFEARTILRPKAKRGQIPTAAANESAFLDAASEPAYRATCEQLFEVCRALGLRFEWGTRGTSIRVPVPDRSEPVSIAWAFPPNTSGWMGLTNFTFGYDGALTASPETITALTQYAATIASLPTAQPVTQAGLIASTFAPSDLIGAANQIAEALAELAHYLSGNS